MTPPLLSAHAAGKTFGSFVAVDAVSFGLGAGEVVGLLGANGAGKTTLIRMLLGLLECSAGSVELLGGEPTQERRRRLGYVPQGLGLYDDLTVAENVAFAAQAYAVEPGHLPEPLSGRSEELVGALPLGVQRQLAFFVALAHRPDVLVLDEPTSGVDALARARLWDTIHDEAARGAGVLVTTHYMQEAEQCDRLLLMAGGRLVAEGTLADIVAGATAVIVHTEDWANAFAALDSAGVAVMLSGRTVRVPNGDLDDTAELLRRAGLTGRLEVGPATLEERMMALSGPPALR